MYKYWWTNPNFLMILIIEFYQTFFLILLLLFFNLRFNHIFLNIIDAFDVFLFFFSQWNDNLSYTTIFVKPKYMQKFH